MSHRNQADSRRRKPAIAWTPVTPAHHKASHRQPTQVAPNHVRPERRSSIRGVALLEALIAFAVLALGTLSVMRMQTTWGAEAAITQQRSQALRFAQREIEALRAFAVPDAAPGTSTFADIVSRTDTIDRSTDADALASYRIVRDVTAWPEDRARSIDLTVEWPDRNGRVQQVALHSVIARADPADSAALQVGSWVPASRGARGRAPTIPLFAKDLGNGRSAIRLASHDRFVVLLDNRSGTVVARCAVDASQPLDGVTATSLGACEASTAVLLTGIVRFAPVGWVPPALADGAPLPFDVTLAMSGGTYPQPPQCMTEAMKAVTFTSFGVSTSRAVPLDALPASVGTTAWTETGDRFSVYRCVVVPRSDGAWSGRSTLAPAGWAVGLGAGDHRVCRYISDSDHSGAIDRNVEHPARYVDVVGTLTQQNFLVIGGAESCPAGDGDDATDPSPVTTAAHQP